MPDATDSPRAMLRQYADILIANAQAATQEERDEVADELIEIVGKMEAHGKEVAELIYELLKHGQAA